MQRITRWVAVLELIGATVVMRVPARAQTETALYSFTGGADGTYPTAGVIRDKKGNLYGTTGDGGDLSTNGGYGSGVVFKLDKNGKYTVIYTFTGGADGANPYYGSLMLDAQGNLYGTTQNGGAVSSNFPSGAGVVFKLSPPYGQNNETVLYTFSGGTDGGTPVGGVIMDKKTGNLYGTTDVGGDLNVGVVYKLSLPYGQSSETVLYSFTGGADGSQPVGSLIMDKKGNLYGQTNHGGNSYGTVFKLSPPSSGGTPWNETVLYTFTGGADGALPPDDAVLIMDKKGNLYGTTQNGGNGYGVVFKLSPPYGQNNETVLYTFSGGLDGGIPPAGLIGDKKGNLYGTAFYGGASNWGVVFKLSPPVGAGPWTETVLYSFSGGADGAGPYCTPIMDKKGNLYGTTEYGGVGQGANGYGVVFEIKQNK